MNVWVFVLLFLYNLILLGHDCQKYGLWPHHYQDIYVSGQTVCKAHGGQNCEDRYQAIKKIVERYNRPVTMIDIGAAEGYFTFRLAHDFPDSVFIMVEENDRDDLLKLCKLNALSNIVYLKKHMSIDDISKLAACEHFDLVLCLNVIHHFKDEWQKALEEVLKLGEKLIIETPPAGSTTSFDLNINNYLSPISSVICSVERWNKKNLLSNTYLVERKKDFIYDTFFANVYNNPLHYRIYKIESNYNDKFMFKFDSSGNLISKSYYSPGINLVTYKALNGFYPARETIEVLLKNTIGSSHSDCSPSNLVLQGNKICLIDTDDQRQGSSVNCSQSVVEKIIQYIKCRFKKLISL